MAVAYVGKMPWSNKNLVVDCGNRRDEDRFASQTSGKTAEALLYFRAAMLASRLLGDRLPGFIGCLRKPHYRGLHCLHAKGLFPPGSALPTVPPNRL